MKYIQMLNCFLTKPSATFKLTIEKKNLLELQICEIWHSRKSRDEYFLLGGNAP